MLLPKSRMRVLRAPAAQSHLAGQTVTVWPTGIYEVPRNCVVVLIEDEAGDRHVLALDPSDLAPVNSERVV